MNKGGASYADRFTKQWAFFDFFDTLVHRRCTPAETKRYWAKEITPLFDMRAPAKKLHDIRIAAEILHSAKNSMRDGEINFYDVSREVYRQLLVYFEDSNYVLPLTGDEFVERSVAIERSVELSNQYVDAEAAELVAELYKRGKQIAVISDFYMGRDDMYRFIQHAGLADYIKRENVFVSCDYGKSKATGGLYTAVFSELKIGCNDCVMAGDDKAKDVKRANEVGIASIHIPYCNKSVPKDERYMERRLDEVAMRDSRGAMRYSNLCFQLFLVIERMYFAMTADGIKDAFFIAREGQFLEKLFNAYQRLLPKYMPNRIRAHYIYASRRSVYPSRLRPIEIESFDKLKPYSALSLRDFLTNIGFGDEAIAEFINATGFEANTAVENFFESQVFNELRQNPAFVAAYERIRKERADCMRGYFAMCGIGGSDRVGFVDVGWGGFVQDCIKAQFPDTPMTGYYIGVSDEGEQRPGNRKKGLLYSPCPVPSRDFDIWSYDKNFMERVLWADHGATDYYYREGETFLPYVKQQGYENEGYSKMQPVQEKILSKFSSICLLFAGSYLTAEDMYEYLLLRHIKTTFLLNAEQLRLQKYLLDHQSQNFGALSSAKTANEKVFSKKIIIKKAFRHLKVLKNSTAVFYICLHNRLYLPIKLLYLVKYRSVVRALRRRRI